MPPRIIVSSALSEAVPSRVVERARITLGWAAGSTREARCRIALPTLFPLAVASVVLLVAVGMQAPAVSTGLRWKPPPRAGTVLRFDSSDGLVIELGGWGEAGLSTLSWLGWVLAGVAAMILFAAMRWILRLIRSKRTISRPAMGIDGSATRPDEQIVQSGLAAALEVLSTEREPGNAVVRAWQGLQDAAAAAGFDRQPSETTSEFTARLLYRSSASAEPISVLQSLYHRVRFGHHSPDADEIATARHALAALVSLWRNDLPEHRGAAK